MNFLAHIYLSGDIDDLKIGNFMADSIKGKNYNNYKGNLRKGILLHRKIDSFTDSHPLVKKSSHRLFKNYRHYNGVIIDVFYDHFLAKNWQDYSSKDLEDYVQNFYTLLKNNLDRVPKNIRHMYPYMVAENWLYNYRKIEGIEHILFQMNNRVKGNFNIHHSIDELQNNYDLFESEFKAFFPKIQDYVEQVKAELNVKADNE